MSFNDFDKEYKDQYHQWPVFSQESSHEGAFKRFVPMPGPVEVFQFALLGLPKIFPLTQELISVDSPVSIADYLTSAITEIEMDMGCNLSEVTHFHSEDYIDGMFSANFSGIRLQRWPAVQIDQVTLKYPHANTKNVYQTYTIPKPWVYLRRNKMNIVASIGSVSINTDASSFAAGGLLTYVTGFARGAYNPGFIEVVYRAGFHHDKLPSMVADLVKTWAAHRYLSDIGPMLFPNSSVNVSIDGVSQGVTFQVQQLIQMRLTELDKKKAELKSAFKKQFAKTMSMSFIGA